MIDFKSSFIVFEIFIICCYCFFTQKFDIFIKFSLLKSQTVLEYTVFLNQIWIFFMKFCIFDKESCIF